MSVASDPPTRRRLVRWPVVAAGAAFGAFALPVGYAVAGAVVHVITDLGLVVITAVPTVLVATTVLVPRWRPLALSLIIGTAAGTLLVIFSFVAVITALTSLFSDPVSG
ncbi:hypothetical protein GE115_02570 [Agromyces sp. CFH 90414]|uniref:Uncharacterized protein n=1 Tax=Agromyces agglutinans TaxID=2662258 RepID=A0A6I2F3G5_9MICO|nr:hypothetical protein [Agromyces agglutinans]MRG58761.1 hypothetical protein [Agromyces agglutinans]